MERMFLKGNEAIAYGALLAGLEAYFAYPITPSSEIPETLAKEFSDPQRKTKYPEYKAFFQSCSEVEAISMVMGAAAGGAKVMTATSSPGWSLKLEGISYITGMELPCVIVDVNRAGPGLGSLGCEQSDYFSATRGGGHGSQRRVVLAPNSVQESFEMPALAFDLAFKYRNPVVILSDSFIGQMKEDIVVPDIKVKKYDTSWAATGAQGRQHNIINSLHLLPDDQEKHELKLYDKFKQMEKNEVRYEEYLTEDADVVLVAYGIMSRVCKSVVNRARENGYKVGLLRPKTLWPYPYQKVSELADNADSFLVVELNMGQMIEDVKLGANGKADVDSIIRLGGNLPSGSDIYKKIEEMLYGRV